MMLFENGRPVGEVSFFREHELRTLRGRQWICVFEVDGEIEGEGPFWLEDGLGEWHIDITGARDHASPNGHHWRVVADMAEEEPSLLV